MSSTRNVTTIQGVIALGGGLITTGVGAEAVQAGAQSKSEAASIGARVQGGTPFFGANVSTMLTRDKVGAGGGAAYDWDAAETLDNDLGIDVVRVGKYCSDPSVVEEYPQFSPFDCAAPGKPNDVDIAKRMIAEDVLTPTASSAYALTPVGQAYRSFIDRPLLLADATARVVLTSPQFGSTITTPVPVFSGSGTPGATVHVRGGTRPYCSALVDASGAWTCTSALEPLGRGDYTGAVRQTKVGERATTTPLAYSIRPAEG